MISKRPLPITKQVCLDYINLYYEVRKDKRESFANQAVYGFQFLTSFITQKEPVDIQTDHFINHLNEAIQKIEKGYHFLLTLIFLLGDSADKSQALKSKEGLSLFCRVAHGLRSLLIEDLQNEDHPYHQAYLDSILMREKKLNDLDKEVDNDITRTKIYELLKELAFLGDEDSIKRSHQCKLFDHFQTANDPKIKQQLIELDRVNIKQGKIAYSEFINFSQAFPLQPKFGHIIYAIRLQKETHKSLEEYMTESLEMEEDDKARKAKVEKMSGEKVSIEKMKDALEKARLNEENARKEAEEAKTREVNARIEVEEARKKEESQPTEGTENPRKEEEKSKQVVTAASPGEKLSDSKITLLSNSRHRNRKQKSDSPLPQDTAQTLGMGK